MKPELFHAKVEALRDMWGHKSAKATLEMLVDRALAGQPLIKIAFDPNPPPPPKQTNLHLSKTVLLMLDAIMRKYDMTKEQAMVMMVSKARSNRASAKLTQAYMGQLDPVRVNTFFKLDPGDWATWTNYHQEVCRDTGLRQRKLVTFEEMTVRAYIELVRKK